jgi:hypothetical protein
VDVSEISKLGVDGFKELLPSVNVDWFETVGKEGGPNRIERIDNVRNKVRINNSRKITTPFLE